jgi:DNA-binding SARP family transcriptional activator
MPRDDEHPTSHDSGLTLVTLGGLALYARRPDGATEQILGPGKHSALLAYLALSSRRSATRDQLVDLLWANLDPHVARHALRQALWYLRQRAGEDVIRTENGDLVLGQTLTLDRDRFLAAVARGALEEAVALYRGEFLQGFAAPGGAEFEHWADVERYRLQHAFAEAAETLARKQLSHGRFRDALRTARGLRDFTPQRQRSWRLLLEALLSAGDHAQAAGEALALWQMLEADGREPDPATARILHRAQAPTPTEPHRMDEEAGTRPPLLPHPELVGREEPFAAVLRAWDAARSGAPRHAHVTAPAGLGKSRLLDDVVSRLRAGGARLVSVRAHQAEQLMGFAVASDLAARLATLPGSAAVSAATAAVLVGLNPTLSGRFDVAPDRSTGDEALRRRTFAMQELVAAVADEAPVALFVDDLHWSDGLSLRVLQALVARLERERVLVVTTSRSMRPAGVSRPDTIEISLRPLGVAHVGQLVTSIGSLPDGESWAERLPGALHAAASGSPLLVLESLQLALERGTLLLEQETWRATDEDRLFTDLAAGGTLRHRIAQLDRSARWVLQLLALAGIPLTAEQITRAVPDQAEDLLASLGALERRGFVVRSGGGGGGGPPRTWTSRTCAAPWVSASAPLSSAPGALRSGPRRASPTSGPSSTCRSSAST